MDWDDAYANAPYIPGADDYPNRWRMDARAFRDGLQVRGHASLGLPYGPSERQAYDLFSPDGASAGLCVFVHGGYWMKFHRDLWSHFAQGMINRGWTVVMPSYDLCPDVLIPAITGQIATAISVAAERTEGPIRLMGHSAGGHLVARMCVDGVLPMSVVRRIRHVLSISPVSDLRPLLKTSLNDVLQLDETIAAAESPALMTPLDIPVTVWVGAEERPVFLDQALWLSQAWGATYVIAENRHHFDVIDPLKNADSEMVQALVSDVA